MCLEVWFLCRCGHPNEARSPPGLAREHNSPPEDADSGLYSNFFAVFATPHQAGRTRKSRGQPRPAAISPFEPLRALLIENDFGFLGRQFFFAPRPGHITQRRRRRQHRTKLPQRTLSLRIAISVSRPYQRTFGREAVLFRVLNMLRHVDHLRLAGNRTGNLRNGSGGTKGDTSNQHYEDCSFHSVLSCSTSASMIATAIPTQRP